MRSQFFYVICKTRYLDLPSVIAPAICDPLPRHKSTTNPLSDIYTLMPNQDSKESFIPESTSFVLEKTVNLEDSEALKQRNFIIHVYRIQNEYIRSHKWTRAGTIIKQ